MRLLKNSDFVSVKGEWERRMGERGEGREYGPEGGGRRSRPWCGARKGQLDSLQAAAAQNYTPHLRKPQTHTEA